MSQMDLARLLGVSRSSISSYENGYRHPDHDTLVRMASCFHVSVDFLLGTENQNAMLNDHYKEVLGEINELLQTSNLSSEKKQEILDEVSEYFKWRLQQAGRKVPGT